MGSHEIKDMLCVFLQEIIRIYKVSHVCVHIYIKFSCVYIYVYIRYIFTPSKRETQMKAMLPAAQHYSPVQPSSALQKNIPMLYCQCLSGWLSDKKKSAGRVSPRGAFLLRCLLSRTRVLLRQEMKERDTELRAERGWSP